ncbi:MAG TPA: YihY/virulence factor BrkB family protein [Polyangiaceae bacterium]|nr:YihY/virulence factor BrkB family protein [Polyangiaceae bacterium]
MPELIQAARRAIRFFQRVLEEFARHRSGLLAAALAYHTLICMSPLVIIAVAVAGMVFGRGAAHLELQRLLQETLGPSGAEAVDEWVVQASQEGELAGAVGVVLLLAAASKLGKQLRHVLNQVWDVGADPFVPGVFAYLRRGLLAMATAAAAGPVLLLFLLSRSLLSLLHRHWFGSGAYWDQLSRGVEWAFMLLVIAVASASAFRYIPDARASWRHVLIGGSFTALLLTCGNAIAGLYFGGPLGSGAYEAAGSGLVLLLWLYFSAYMFLMGAEFTQLLSRSRSHG